MPIIVRNSIAEKQGEKESGKKTTDAKPEKKQSPLKSDAKSKKTARQDDSGMNNKMAKNKICPFQTYSTVPVWDVKHTKVILVKAQEWKLDQLLEVNNDL